MPDKIIIENESKGLSSFIKEMAEKDVEAVMKIESTCFDFPWNGKISFINYVKRGDAFVVSTVENVIVGYVLIKRKGDTIELCKMAVEPDHQHSGYGKLIVNWTKEFTKGYGAKRLLLHVRASNYEAIGLYQKSGFEELEKIENYYKKTGSLSEEKAAIKMEWVCSS